MVNSEMYQLPGVVHVTVLLVSLLDVKGGLKYILSWYSSYVICSSMHPIKFADLCAAFKLLLLVFLGSNCVRNLLRDALIPMLILEVIQSDDYASCKCGLDASVQNIGI